MVVLDLGSSTTKAGFAGEEIPRCEFPSVVLNKPEEKKKNPITSFL